MLCPTYYLLFVRFVNQKSHSKSDSVQADYRLAC
nr:MAG TPA: hypothetical protein [Caudoviricetes sp.]DAX46272.1 MAG TPA: hypothetical protein [Caudoviricetes sp.]